MALSKDQPRAYELGTINELPVKAAVKIYENAVVGVEVATGYARPLVAGDAFGGFAESSADNSGGSSGDIRVRARTKGVVQIPLSGAALTDYGAKVYASDDGTFTKTAGSNTYVGRVYRYVSTGVVLLAFDTPFGQVA